MKKLLFLSVFFMLNIAFLSNIKAQEITLSPSNPKIGDKVTVKITIPTVPADADMVNIYITDTLPANILEADSYLKKSVNPFVTGNTFNYNYTWDTTQSNPGEHNIVVAVLGKLEPGRQRAVLSTNNTSLTLSSTNGETANTNNTDGTNTTSTSSSSNWAIPTLSFVTGKSFSQIAGNIVNWLLVLAGILAVIFLVYGGILYITAGPDAEKATKGRTAVVNSVIGITIIILALAIINWVVNIF